MFLLLLNITNQYYTFCSSMLRQYNTDVIVKTIKFHYFFDTTSELHGFLNNYLNIPIGQDIVGMIYKCGDCFRSKGSVVPLNHTDYFLISTASNGDILFDLSKNIAHITCRTDEIDSIVR